MAKPIDAADRKLLYLLDLDSRAHLGTLAKKVRLSREAVRARILRLRQSGILSKSLMVLDIGMLGFSSYKVYIELQRISAKEEEQLVQSLKENGRIAFIARAIGKFDLVFSLFAKTPTDFNEQISEILKKWKKCIRHYDTCVTLEGIAYPRKFLWPEEELQESRGFAWKEREQIPVSDQLDRAILKLLGEDGFLSYSELARKLSRPIDTVRSRVIAMRTQGTISAFKIQLDKGKLGYRYFKLFLVTDPLGQEQEAKLFSFFSRHENVVFALKNLGPWNYELDIELRDDQDIVQIIRGIKDRVGQSLVSSESIECYSEPKFNYCSFGW